MSPRGRSELLDVTTVLYMVASLLVSVGIVIANKVVLNTKNFKFPLFLTSCHFLVNAVFVTSMQSGGVFVRKRIPLWAALLYAASSGLAILSCNWSLHLNSVAVYQSFKLLGIPVSACVYSLLNIHSLSWRMCFSLATICGGTLCVIFSEHFDNIWASENAGDDVAVAEYVSHGGLLVGFCSIFFNVFDQILFGEISRWYSASTMQVQQATLLYRGLFCLLFVLLIETQGESPVQERLRTGDLSLFFSIGVTCVLAFGVNIISPTVVARTSSTTYQILGNAKFIASTALGWALFPQAQKSTSWAAQLFGVVLTTAGVAFYFWLKTANKSSKRRELNFSDEFVDIIRSGEKTATTRVDKFQKKGGSIERVGDFVPGMQVSATDQSGSTFAVIKVTAVEKRLYKNIDDKLARLENLESAAALKTVLKKFYKDLNDKSELCVVHFKVVQAPTSPTIELKKKKL